MNISTGTYVLGIFDVVLYLDINAGKWGPRLWKLKVATAIQYGVINPFGHMPLEFAGNKLNGMLGPNPEGNSACFWKCSVKALLPAIGVRSFLFGDHVCSAHAGVKISYSKNAAPHNVKAHNTKRTRISWYRICQWPHGIKMRANSHAWECVKQAELERKTHFSAFSSLACALVCLQAPVWDLDGRSELQMILWILPGLGSQHMGPKRGLRMKTLNFPLGMVSRQILIQWSSTRDRSTLDTRTLARVPRSCPVLLWLPWGLVFLTLLRGGAFGLVRPILLILSISFPHHQLPLHPHRTSAGRQEDMWYDWYDDVIW